MKCGSSCSIDTEYLRFFRGCEKGWCRICYDVVWHREVFSIQAYGQNDHGLVRNRNFTLTTADSKQSRCRHRKNGIPPRLVLTTLLFNFFICAHALHDFQKVCLCGRSSIVAIFWKLEGHGGDFKSTHDNAFSISSDLKAFRRCLKGHPLRVSHKQDWDQEIIFLPAQASVLLRSDADSDGVEAASGFTIQNARPCASYGARCMGHAVRMSLQFLYGCRIHNSVKERVPICALTTGITQHHSAGN